MENKKTFIIVGIVAIIIFAVILTIIIIDSNSDKEEDRGTSNTTSTSKTKENTVKTEEKENEEEKTEEAENVIEETEKTEEKEEEFDYLEAAEEQMSTAKSGETIAIMHVKGYGDITFKFFDDKAPKAVENFLTHAKEGYYDGVKFHRVMEEFMIQGGDPKGDGTGGESIWGKGFEEELDQGLVPYRGALCMASAGTGTSSLGSQFFIVQAHADEEQANMMSLYGYPESLTKAYEKYGGYLSLYGYYTVFGQVIDGMDTVDKIAKVEKTISSTGELSVPVSDIVIESIEVKNQK